MLEPVLAALAFLLALLSMTLRRRQLEALAIAVIALALIHLMPLL